MLPDVLLQLPSLEPKVLQHLLGLGPREPPAAEAPAGAQDLWTTALHSQQMVTVVASLNFTSPPQEEQLMD